MDLNNIHFVISLGNLIALLGIWRKISIKDYQLKMMWEDYKRRHGIMNGEHKRETAVSGD